MFWKTVNVERSGFSWSFGLARIFLQFGSDGTDGTDGTGMCSGCVPYNTLDEGGIVVLGQFVVYGWLEKAICNHPP